jgi:hypothetical protein
MSFCGEQHHVLEVGMVDMRVHSEESLENYFDDVNEVFREGNSKLAGEDFFVVQLILHPGHQEINVLCCANF